MTVSILKNPSEVSRYVKTVFTEADKHSKELGFFAEAVYTNFCDKGTLWVLIEDGKYVGHLMFSVTFSKNKIAVNQAFILNTSRKKGYGKILIDELKKWGEKHNITHIKARVADDLKTANKFYNNLGFKAIQQVDGGAALKRKINIRSLTLNTPSLLSLMENSDNAPFSTSAPVNTECKYVLDLNVIIDFLEQRANKEHVEIILKRAMQGDLKVFITAEAKAEALRSSQPASTKPDYLLNLVKALPELPVTPDKEIKTLSPEIEKIIFGTIDKDAKSATNKSSDVMHIVHSIHNGCTGFVTRDDKILKSATALYDNYRLEVFSPDEFFLNEVDSANNNIALNAEGITFTIDAISDADEKKLKPILKNLGIAHDKISIAQYRGLLVTVGNGNPAVAIWSKPHKKRGHISAYILYAEGFNNTSVFDHILESIFRSVRNEGASLLAIYTKNTDEIITNTLNKRGFSSEPSDDCTKHTRFISDKIISSKEWDGFCKDFKKFTKREINGTLQPYDKLQMNGIIIGSKSVYHDFFDFETRLSPALIIPKGRKAVIIPIKPSFADELIENNKIQLQLGFEKQPAFLKMEKAYFKKPGAGCKIKKGDLILFYASSPVSAIVGAARTTFSDDQTIEEIKFKFKQQGVLEDAQLQEVSNLKTGKVHTITFDNFIPFCKNVSLKELKGLDLGNNNFQTTTETTGDVFLKVCALGGVHGE